ncbi:MAG TPA: alanyl-tRNA editing protein [Clostridia bacterium]|nr:alanyl-tRNA editing protein [Clostridia bacterium]
MQKGYWEDAGKLQFDGVVASTEDTARGLVVRLEKTYFYPESGGQLADGGTVDGTAILDARQDASGPFVVLPSGFFAGVGQHLACVVDAEKRGRHTQLHSAQHILSRLLDDRGIRTLSFHMTEDEASIEIETTTLSSSVQSEIEDAVERLVWRCLPVDTLFVDAAHIGSYDVRKVPELAGGPLRLVRIGDIDTNPCGGTHVASTGEIGGFAIVRTDKVRGNTRLYFVAGRTATAYQRRNEVVLRDIEQSLTCGLGDVVASIARLRQHDHEVSAHARGLQAIAVDELARQAMDDLTSHGTAAMVLDSVPAELARMIVARLPSAPGPLCVLIYPAGGVEGQFVCSVPPGSEPLLAAFNARMKETFGARSGGAGRVIQGKIDARLTSDQLKSLLVAG